MTDVTSSSKQVILRTRGVGKAFGKFVALNNISAEFSKGRRLPPDGGSRGPAAFSVAAKAGIVTSF